MCIRDSSRLGFVYFAQVNNILRKDVITEAQKNSLLLSVKSISTKMKSDAYQVKLGKKSLSSFLDIYGHIRAGNYNLSSSNLKNNLEFTEHLNIKSNSSSSHSSKWTPAFGEEKNILNEYNLMNVLLSKDSLEMLLLFKIFNDGVAFKYEVPNCL